MKTFQLEVRNQFTVLRNQQELDLHNFNSALAEAGTKILGPRRRQKEVWNSEDTWKKIDKRKEKKGKF